MSPVCWYKEIFSRERGQERGPGFSLAIPHGQRCNYTYGVRVLAGKELVLSKKRKLDRLADF